MSSFVHANNKNKHILIIGKGQTKEIDNDSLQKKNNLLILQDQKAIFV